MANLPLYFFIQPNSTFMLDNLFNLVKEYSGDAVVNNPDVPNEYNEEVMAVATQSVAGGLQQSLANGGLADVLRLFNGQGGEVQQSPIFQNISGGFIQDLVGRFNMNERQASGVAGSLLPLVINNLIRRTNDPNNSSFDIAGILSSLTGGSTQGLNIQSLVSRFTQGGLDRDGDGDTDLQDIISTVTNGARQQANNPAAGGEGLMDMIKGFMAR
jgi:uncharacterized protein YidB (DUF937 family)